jgi:hypothetical protein
VEYADVLPCKAVFDAQVDRSPEGCHRWIGVLNPNGYGLFRVFTVGKNTGAHRVSWALANGRMPKKGFVIMHSCDNPICVNPKHLSEGTFSQNTKDAWTRGRVKSPMLLPHVRKKISGEQNVWSVLKESEVLVIIQELAKGSRAAPLARRFGVSTSTISAIKSGDKWAYLPRPAMPPVLPWRPPMSNLAYKCLEMRKAGIAPREIAQRLGVEAYRVGNILRTLFANGDLDRKAIPKIRRGRPRDPGVLTNDATNTP